jgi:hypothetical protein
MNYGATIDLCTKTTAAITRTNQNLDHLAVAVGGTTPTLMNHNFDFKEKDVDGDIDDENLILNQPANQ